MLQGVGRAARDGMDSEASSCHMAPHAFMGRREVPARALKNDWVKGEEEMCKAAVRLGGQKMLHRGIDRASSWVLFSKTCTIWRHRQDSCGCCSECAPNAPVGTIVTLRTRQHQKAEDWPL